jgi:hypothetical protein
MQGFYLDFVAPGLDSVAPSLDFVVKDLDFVAGDLIILRHAGGSGSGISSRPACW